MTQTAEVRQSEARASRVRSLLTVCDKAAGEIATVLREHLDEVGEPAWLDWCQREFGWGRSTAYARLNPEQLEAKRQRDRERQAAHRVQVAEPNVRESRTSVAEPVKSKPAVQIIPKCELCAEDGVDVKAVGSIPRGWLCANHLESAEADGDPVFRLDTRPDEVPVQVAKVLGAAQSLLEKLEPFTRNVTAVALDERCSERFRQALQLCVEVGERAKTIRKSLPKPPKKPKVHWQLRQRCAPLYAYACPVRDCVTPKADISHEFCPKHTPTPEPPAPKDGGKKTKVTEPEPKACKHPKCPPMDCEHPSITLYRMAGDKLETMQATNLSTKRYNEGWRWHIEQARERAEIEDERKRERDEYNAKVASARPKYAAMTDAELQGIDEDVLCEADRAEWRAWRDERGKRGCLAEEERERQERRDPLAGIDDDKVTV